MATATPLYGTNAALTITLASLATDATLLIGRQSTVISNATDLAMDCELGGAFVLTATPTTGKQIEVWAGASYDAGTTYTAGAGASDAALTVRATTKALFKSVIILPTDTTTTGYTWGGVLLSQVFGFVPARWFLWVAHNTGTALTSGAIRYTPIKFQSA